MSLWLDVELILSVSLDTKLSPAENWGKRVLVQHDKFEVFRLVVSKVYYERKIQNSR